MSLILALSLATTAPLASAPSSRNDAEVQVNIQSDSPDVSLFRVVSEGVGSIASSRGMATIGIVNYARECQAPCNMRILEPRSEFFIGGNGITPSSRFSLLDQGRNVSLHVRPGSSGLRATGWYSIVVGASAALAGGLLLGLSGSMQTEATGSTDDPFMRKLSIGSLIGGGALLAIGIPLFAFNGTDVKVVANQGPPDTGRGSLDL
ncbi:hypothetical protein [Corallococcus sp. Z5C101001]|uniref:hypothetical protein n=1 Tax=Corallococcus sp. Z5C101001 TaxID=2596829 RepID=UPI001180C12C|nr:hypothetical protein [Corallococcus sp. Z5C101001]TSC31246.1 hypothetical protein FOF48_11155 [Corallococcus sp. Z5C101001]